MEKFKHEHIRKNYVHFVKAYRAKKPLVRVFKKL